MSNIVKYVKWFLSRVRDQVVIETAVLSDHTWPDLPHYRKQEIILSAYLFSWTEYSGQQTTKNDWNRFACEGSRKPNLWRFWDTQIMKQFPAAHLHLVFPVSSDLVWISSRFLAPKPRFPTWATMQRDLRFSSFDIGPSTDLWQTDRQTDRQTDGRNDVHHDSTPHKRSSRGEHVWISSVDVPDNILQHEHGQWGLGTQTARVMTMSCESAGARDDCVPWHQYEPAAFQRLADTGKHLETT